MIEGESARIAMNPGRSARLPRVEAGEQWLRRTGSGALAIARQLWLPYLLTSILILYGFWWGLPIPPYVASSFQPDEGAAVSAVMQLKFPSFNPLILAWGTALFYQAYLMKKILTAGGLIHLSSDLWVYVAGRLVVYLSALGAITATFLAGQRLSDRRTGWLAALFLSVLPGFVISGHYFKMDVPVACWIAVTLLTTLWMLDAPSVRRVAILGFLVGYSASVKYNAAGLAPVAAIAVVLAYRKSWRAIPILPFIAAMTAGFAIGEPYGFLNLPSLIYWVRWVAGVDTVGSPYAIGRPPAWLDYPINIFPYAMTLPFLLLFAVAIVYAIARRVRHAYVLLLFLVAYYPLLCADNSRFVRFVVPLLPVAAILVALLVRDIAKMRRGRWVYRAGVFALVAYVFIFSLSFTRAFAQPDPRVQGEQWVQAHLSKGTPIAVSTTHSWNVPDLHLIGYQSVSVGDSITKLEAVKGPYLILSDIPMLEYEEAIDHYPTHKAFYAYINTHYCKVTSFLNSQELLGINSRAGRHLPGDWLDPNPRITILKRASGGC